VRTRLAIPLGAVMSSFAHALIFDIVSLALLIIPAMAMAGMENDSVPMMLGVGVVLATISIGVLLALPYLCQTSRRLVEKLPLLPNNWRSRFAKLLADTEQELRRSRDSGCYWRLLALSFGVRCCKYASYYILFIGLVVPLGFVIADFPVQRVFLGLVSAELAASLPISGIAGFGAYEGAWALVFQLLGYPERIAVLTSISHHLVTQVYGYTLGAGALLLLLLPTFAKQSERRGPATMGSRRGFWFRFTMLTAVIIAATAFLLPEMGPSTSPAAMSEKLVKPGSVDPFEGVMGRVVYQRPQGLFVSDIATGKSFQLAPYGRVPRWSPDGKSVAFLRRNQVLVVDGSGGNPVVVAEGVEVQTLVFGPDNHSVLFSDGNLVKRVDLNSKETTIVAQGSDFRELDINLDGTFLASTEKTLTGYQVRLYNLAEGNQRTVSRGCSASLSPHGQFITSLTSNHQVLKLHGIRQQQQAEMITAPPDQKFDNHFWSNHPDYIASTREGEQHDILIHHVPTDSSLQVTRSGDADRADLYIDGP